MCRLNLQELQFKVVEHLFARWHHLKLIDQTQRLFSINDEGTQLFRYINVFFHYYAAICHLLQLIK